MSRLSQSTKTKYKILAAVGAFFVIAGLLTAILLRDNQSTDVLGATSNFSEVLPAALPDSFPVYYFENNFPPNSLKLDEESISYSSGTLIFSLVNPGGLTLAVTQQQLPTDFIGSDLQGDENFDTAAGPATISLTADGRATGTLVTSENTLILLNTESAIELTTIKDILRGLRPI